MYYYPQNNAGAGYPQYQTQVGIKGRPVSSLEEARAAQIDFDGSLFVFPDIAHNRIYTKQISLDGNATLNAYELVQTPLASSTMEPANYITREEFETTMGKVKDALDRMKTPAAASKLDF